MLVCMEVPSCDCLYREGSFLSLNPFMQLKMLCVP